MVMRIILNPGETLIVEEFTYPHVPESMLDPLGYKTLPIGMDDLGLIPEALEEQLAKFNIDMVSAEAKIREGAAQARQGYRRGAHFIKAARSPHEGREPDIAAADKGEEGDADKDGHRSKRHKKDRKHKKKSKKEKRSKKSDSDE